MVHIVIGIILIIVCCIKGNRGSCKEYYSTIIIFILGDAVYNFVMFNYPLWIYNFPGWPELGHTYIDLYWAVVIFPCIVILFLTFLPKGVVKTAGYIAGWSAAFALTEYIMYLSKGMVYFNGWNTLFSFFFDIVMFTVLFVHYKKPVAAWIMIAAIVPVFILIVRMPLAMIR